MNKGKLTLFLGAISTTIVPVVATISCSPTNGIKHYTILPTYTAQADQLIALGIKPDYYPLQLDQKHPFSYLTNPSLLMTSSSTKFKDDFSKKIATLVPEERGTSWWNQQALEVGERGSVPEYWQHVSGDFVMYEHYLLDDGDKAVDSSVAPKHIKHEKTYLETNFRQSRDPYTRLPKDVMEALLDKSEYDASPSTVQNIVKELLEVARSIEGEDPALIAVDGKPMPEGTPKRSASERESWLYNDFVFARHYHNDFIDNADFQSSPVANMVINKNGGHSQWVFDKRPAIDKQLAKLFFAATFKEQEKNIGLKAHAERSYNLTSTRHHPIYEQQEEIGGAPMFEGAQRDNLLYFYNTADKIQKAFTQPPTSDPVENQSAYKYLKDKISPSSFEKLSHARDIATTIIDELNHRMDKVKKIVDAVGNPTYGIFTLAPGAGVSTIQTSSKYSFIYNELGFTQPSPTNIPLPSDGLSGNSFFNMDDNGWWWNLSDEDGQVNGKRTAQFKNQFDLGIMTAQSTQFNNMKEVDKDEIADMFKGVTASGLNNLMVDYNVWNEGVKSPFVLHMVLDYIITQLDKHYGTTSGVQTLINDAKDWGNYFTTTFLK